MKFKVGDITCKKDNKAWKNKITDIIDADTYKIILFMNDIEDITFVHDVEQYEKMFELSKETIFDKQLEELICH